MRTKGLVTAGLDHRQVGCRDSPGFIVISTQPKLASRQNRLPLENATDFNSVLQYELTTEELQEILNGEPQETQRNVSPEQEEDEKAPMLTSAIKDLLKQWADARAMVLEWHPNQADVSRVGDLYNNNAINYFWKILKKREKQSTLDMFFNAP
ncbi:uncharacterized protein TNCV_78621 [Trichonephila clavipes]|nr:uncharacterized protein TNCV_78621 [Trichonephila clavipes]